MVLRLPSTTREMLIQFIRVACHTGHNKSIAKLLEKYQNLLIKQKFYLADVIKILQSPGSNRTERTVSLPHSKLFTGSDLCK
jgi:bifunctional N-acetylglucosamine-1-phosphate-uridyltransferase/glucosamine-1-phosphate-acetyltransferase GlmU-like protein